MPAQNENIEHEDIGLGLIKYVKDYNPEPQRERLRGIIALTLIGILAGSLVWIMTLVSIRAIDATTLNTLLTGVFTPLLAATGVATGFYFATTKS